MTTRFEALRVGDDLPAQCRENGDPRGRARVRGRGRRSNPLHPDDDVARMVGFPGIIAHGMFTMGHLGACVSTWAGDSANVVRLSAQFRAPVFMGEEIVAGGRVRSLDAETRTATAELWVTVERERTTEFADPQGRGGGPLARPTPLVAAVRA